MSRRIAVWLVILLVLIALVVSAASSTPSPTATTTPLQRHGITYSGTKVQDGSSKVRVATVSIKGVVVDGPSASDGSSTGSDDVVRLFDALAAKKKSWDGVILELDTPGGSVTAAEEIHAAIERFKSKTKLPVIAWMRGTAASAGYYVAAPTDRIVASANTFTGSIGVILEYYVVKKLAEKAGVEAVTVKSGALKDIGNPFRSTTKEERDIFQTIINQAYDQFVEVVAKGRSMPEAKVRELADGRVYTGLQAKENGLVDETGLRSTAYDAIAKLIGQKGVRGEQIDVVEFSRDFGVFSSLFASVREPVSSLGAAADVARAAAGDPAAIRRVAGSSTQGAPASFARLEYRAVIGG